MSVLAQFLIQVSDYISVSIKITRAYPALKNLALYDIYASVLCPGVRNTMKWISQVLEAYFKLKAVAQKLSSHGILSHISLSRAFVINEQICQKAM